MAAAGDNGSVEKRNEEQNLRRWAMMGDEAHWGSDEDSRKRNVDNQQTKNWQVRFTFTKQGPRFHMPPPYSIVIQESERGSWHIPIVGGDDIEISRKWLCITRSENFQYQKQNNQASQNKIPDDSQLSKLEDTHEMIYQSKVPVDEIEFSTADSTSKKTIFSDSSKESASVTTGGKMPKHSSFSSPYGSKKNRKGHSVLSQPTLPTATITRQKIEAAEKHRGFTIDFQI